jgi:hypothetical protein
LRGDGAAHRDQGLAGRIRDEMQMKVAATQTALLIRP